MMSALANHLLQSTVFAAVAGVLTLFLRNNHARTRYWIWLTASVKFLVPFSLFVEIGHRLNWSSALVAMQPHIAYVMDEVIAPAYLASAPLPPGPFVHTASLPSIPPELLAAVWATGCAAFLIFWLTRWMRVAAALSCANVITDGRAFERMRRLGSRAKLVSLTNQVEPGVFGILRPVLCLPQGIAEHLDDTQLDAIFVHELTHIRRRDNLTAALHMLVEAIFWFHPLVWWMGARLVEERERACDEEVIRLGSDPEVYAGSILEVCRHYLASPIFCAAGISGSDLKKRVESIMSNTALSGLSTGKKLAITAVLSLAFVAPVVVGIATVSSLHAQPKIPEAPLSFEVASVKDVGAEAPAGLRFSLLPHRSGNRVQWVTNLALIFRYAYHLQNWQMPGVPLSDTEVVVEATAKESATEDEIRRMFQTLLAERFKVQAHREIREGNGYWLVTAKGGAKISPVKPEDPPAPIPDWWKRKGDSKSQDDAISAMREGKVIRNLNGSSMAFTGRRVTMAQLAAELQDAMGGFVVDKTGLPGSYYFGFLYTKPDQENADVPTLPTALQDNLGLKLEPHKGPVEILVVDHMQKTPTEN